MKQGIHRSYPGDYENDWVLSRALCDEARKNGLIEITRMVNTGDFISLCCDDLEILVDHLCSRPSITRASLYARVACLIIAELLDNVPSITGKKFQNIVGTLTGEEGLRKFRSITRKFSHIRKAYEANVRKIRNVAIAHRDHDVEAQLTLIETLDLGSVIALTTELMRWHTLFIRFQIKMYRRVIEELRAGRDKGHQTTVST